jgi:hypothetical protein
LKRFWGATFLARAGTNREPKIATNLQLESLKASLRRCVLLLLLLTFVVLGSTIQNRFLMNKEEHYADEVLAEQLLLVGGGVVRKRSNVGSNFKIIEDIMLASPYVFVTTKAAVGTDQDGNTFWDKICKSFIKHGGQEGRTRVSLKNRFNKVLQAEINKYVGCLHSVLCEYHSGWVLDDYTAKGKTRFQLKHG